MHAEIYSGECGANLRWSLNTQDSTLTITGTGAMTNWESTYDVPWYKNNGKIKFVTLPEGLTSIGGGAFASCYHITSVTMPNSVTSIDGVLSLIAAVWHLSLFPTA